MLAGVAGRCGTIEDMSDASRLQRLRALVEEISGKPAPADEEESLFDSGLLDSNNLIDLVSAIEESFSLKIPDISPQKFGSLARIDAYLADRGA